jgi:hypothetical protein
VDAIASVTSALNKGIATAEARARVHELQTRLIGAPQLIAPHREVVREGSLVKIGQHGRRNRHYFILLNDCLVYGDTLPLSGGRIAYKQTIILQAVEAEPDDAKAKVVHAFRVSGSPKSFVCLADDAGARDAWVRDGAAVVAALRSRRTPVAGATATPAAGSAAAFTGLSGSRSPTEPFSRDGTAPAASTSLLLPAAPPQMHAPTLLPAPVSGRRGSRDSGASGGPLGGVAHGAVAHLVAAATEAQDAAARSDGTAVATPLRTLPSASSLRQRATGDAVVGVAATETAAAAVADAPGEVVSGKGGKGAAGGSPLSPWASPAIAGAVLVGAVLAVALCVWWLRASHPAHTNAGGGRA